jgi:hypothetical protein
MSDNTPPGNKRKAVIPPEIYLYLSKILEDAQATGISEEVREEMVYQMYKRFDKFCTARIIQALPTDEDCDTFVSMTQEKKSPEETVQFLQEKIPDYDAFLLRTSSEYRGLYVPDSQ